MVSEFSAVGVVKNLGVINRKVLPSKGSILHAVFPELHVRPVVKLTVEDASKKQRGQYKCYANEIALLPHA